MHWRRKWQPTPVFLPGESQGRGAWWAAVYGVAQSQTRRSDLAVAVSLGHFRGPLSNLREEYLTSIIWYVELHDRHCSMSNKPFQVILYGKMLLV